jgi:hypothetical protein
MALSITKVHRYAECDILFVVMLCAIMLSAIMLSVIMLNVFIIRSDIS